MSHSCRAKQAEKQAARRPPLFDCEREEGY